MNHPTNLKEYPGGVEGLITDLSNLRYDALADFLKSLAGKMKRDAEADADHQRYKLANWLYLVSEKLGGAAEMATEAWRICEPYITAPGKAYEAGHITGYEAASIMARAVTEENAEESVAAIKHFPHFRKEMVSLIERFGSLTDEQWASMRTFSIEEEYARMRRGIEILKRYDLDV